MKSGNRNTGYKKQNCEIRGTKGGKKIEKTKETKVIATILLISRYLHIPLSRFFFDFHFSRNPIFCFDFSRLKRVPIRWMG